jgi:hypothetical protein
MSDLETVIMQIKNTKSPEYDELTTDMIKAARPIGTQWLYHVLKRIWTENKIPKDWYKRTIIPICKKIDRKKIWKYTGIMFL